MSSLDEISLKDWPKEKVAELFDLVKPNEALWNPSSPSWSNKTLKGHLWLNVAQKLDPYLSARRCRDRFISFRRRFANDIRKQIQAGVTINPELLWILIPDEEKENQAAERVNETPTSPPTLALLESVSRHSTGSEEVVTEVKLEAVSEDVNQKKNDAETSDPIEPPVKRQKRKPISTPKISTDHSAAPRQTPAVPHLPMSSNSSGLQNSFQSTCNILYLYQLSQAMEQKRQIDEECEIFGRLIKLDLQRLSTSKRSQARQAIIKVIEEIHSSQNH